MLRKLGQYLIVTLISAITGACMSIYTATELTSEAEVFREHAWEDIPRHVLFDIQSARRASVLLDKAADLKLQQHLLDAALFWASVSVGCSMAILFVADVTAPFCRSMTSRNGLALL